MKRIIIFTGKGGVGKSSVAAAHAKASAAEGKKTLLVSTDMAHNLGDIFGCMPGKESKEVIPKLHILEVDPVHLMEEDYADIKSGFAGFFKSTNISEDIVDQLTILPGIDALFSLLKIMDIYEKTDFERIIVDCAPTGETLALLKFPEMLSWYIEKFFPIEKVAIKVLSPVSKQLFKVEMPEQRALNDIERMYMKMGKLQKLLRNDEVTSICLVAMPEKMVVEETKRNYMYLKLYHFHVDGLYINRILPEGMDNPFFAEWTEIQKKYVKELQAVFGDLPVWQIPWFDTDLGGAEGIGRLETEIAKGGELFRIMKPQESECYEKTACGYQLRMHLPCASKEEIQMHDSPSDLIIKIHNFKRCIPKPNVLRTYDIVSADLKDEILTLQFEPAGAKGGE